MTTYIARANLTGDRSYREGEVVNLDHLTPGQINLLLGQHVIEKTDTALTVSELELVKGITGEHARAFADAGIVSLAELDRADVGQLVTLIPGANAKTLARWKTAAALLQEERRAPKTTTPVAASQK